MDGFGKLVSAALVALGLGFAGFSIGKGFVDARQLDRSVEVKGLAERDVTADTAIWPLQFVVAGDDLESLVDKIATQREAVTAFLLAQGFTTDEISVSAPSVRLTLPALIAALAEPANVIVSTVTSPFTVLAQPR